MSKIIFLNLIQPLLVWGTVLSQILILQNSIFYVLRNRMHVTLQTVVMLQTEVKTTLFCPSVCRICCGSSRALPSHCHVPGGLPDHHNDCALCLCHIHQRGFRRWRCLLYPLLLKHLDRSFSSCLGCLWLIRTSPCRDQLNTLIVQVSFWPVVLIQPLSSWVPDSVDFHLRF